MMTDKEMLKFRGALGKYATGVTVVTTEDKAGDKVGMTASSFASLSLNPPLVLWSIDKDTGCFDSFIECEHFAIHVLREDQQDISDHFAGRGFDKFQNIPTHSGIGRAPLLKEFCALFECSIEHHYEGGDHVIIVGRVLKMEARDGNPLIFADGKYSKLDL